MTVLKSHLKELGDQELLELNTRLAEAAEMSEAHLAYYNDLSDEERNYEDESVCSIEEAYLFLYRAWSEYLERELVLPKHKMN